MSLVDLVVLPEPDFEVTGKVQGRERLERAVTDLTTDVEPPAITEHAADRRQWLQRVLEIDQTDPALDGQRWSRSIAQGGQQRISMGKPLGLEAEVQFTLQLVQARRGRSPPVQIGGGEAFELVERRRRSRIR